MAEYVAAGNYWVLPTIDALLDGEVRMHVSVCVGSITGLGEQDVEVTMEAQGQVLEKVAGPSEADPLTFVMTKAISAIAFFTFANPNDLTPSSVTVRIRDGSATFDVGAALEG